MAEDPIRGAQLRTPVPTLEPDEAFVARLSQLAAASTPGSPSRSAPAPYAGWRVALAAAAVAAVLVGVAWLAGLRPGDQPQPAHQPTPTPAPSRTSDPQPERGVATDHAVPTTSIHSPSTRGASSPGGEGRGDGHHGVAGVSPSGGQPGNAGSHAGGASSGGAGQQPGTADQPGQDGTARDEHARGQQHANEHAGQHPSVRAGQGSNNGHGGQGGPGRDGHPGVLPDVITTTLPAAGRPTEAGQRD